MGSGGRAGAGEGSAGGERKTWSDASGSAAPTGGGREAKARTTGIASARMRACAAERDVMWSPPGPWDGARATRVPAAGTGAGEQIRRRRRVCLSRATRACPGGRRLDPGFTARPRCGSLGRSLPEVPKMNRPVRPRRSVLYMPGSNARALEKARSLDADALILDLEDAVAPAAKEEARALVMAALAHGGYGHRERVERVNGAATPWAAADLAAAARSGADAVLLPKVEAAETVREAERALAAAGAPPELALWCMIETPRGVLAADAIAGGSARLACLVVGTSDLTKDLGARATAARLEVLTSLGLVLLAARAHGDRKST